MIKTSLRSLYRSSREASRGEDNSFIPVHGWYEPWHRAMDVVVAALMFAVAAPMIALAGLMVKLTSKGPVLYKQTRLGRYGKAYTIYKLRTMTNNCEKFSGPCWAQVHDPRVTPVGWFLRALHIDELPQLWNVLKGDMSLVGPRPERPEIVRNLEKLVPHYRKRLALRPGITGLAQVLMPADRDVEHVRSKLPYDLHYVYNASPWLDLSILLTTILYLVAAPIPLRRALLWLPSGMRLHTPMEETAVRNQVEQVELVPLVQG